MTLGQSAGSLPPVPSAKLNDLGRDALRWSTGTPSPPAWPSGGLGALAHSSANHSVLPVPVVLVLVELPVALVVLRVVVLVLVVLVTVVLLVVLVQLRVLLLNPVVLVAVVLRASLVVVRVALLIAVVLVTQMNWWR